MYRYTAAEREAAEAAAAAKVAADMETPKGRRALAREKLYAKDPGAAGGPGGGGGEGGPKPGLSWLTKHVKNLGWGDEERIGGGSGGGRGGGVAAADEQDEVADAAAATLAGVSLGKGKKERTEADEAMDAVGLVQV